MLRDRWRFLLQKRDSNGPFSSVEKKDEKEQPTPPRRLAVLRGSKVVEVSGAPERETR